MINRLIRTLQREVRLTSVVVTHDMRSAAEVGDRILMLLDGRFVADGTADELQKSRNVHVRRFVSGEAEPEDLLSLRGRDPKENAVAEPAMSGNADE